MIRVWSIQRAALLKRLKAGHAITGALSRVPLPDRPAYIWMSTQLGQFAESSDPSLPVWAWYSYEGSRHAPDLRRTWHLPRGSDGVLLELQVARDRLLLSQFEMWTWVMAQRFVPLDYWDWKRAELRVRHNKLKRIDIERSWCRIFDLRSGNRNFWGPYCRRSIQACLQSIKAQDVTSVKRFTAR